MFSKVLGWVVGLTSVGKKTNEFLDGKKQMLASLGSALAATAMIFAKLSEQGAGYLVHVAGTPEFAQLPLVGLDFLTLSEDKRQLRRSIRFSRVKKRK